MGRGVSSGGGQSSLGYLFGGNEAPAPKPAATNVEAPPRNPAPAPAPAASNVVAEKSSAPTGEPTRQIPAGIQGSQKNNYYRADGQNTGNFLTVWLCICQYIVSFMCFYYDFCPCATGDLGIFLIWNLYFP